MRDLRTTNILLLIIAVPVVFYLLKILSFIFIPLVASMFITLFFLPIMRWLNKMKIPKPISIIIMIMILVGTIKVGVELIKLSTREIVSADGQLFETVETKVLNVIEIVENFLGIERLKGDNVFMHYLQDSNLFSNFGSTLDFITGTLSVILMTIFFVILLLYESINIQEVLNTLLFKSKHRSIKAFAEIEKDIVKFAGVKFLMSLFTGIGFGLACYFFDVSFPIFWGLFAFLVNFIQVVGSVVSVILLSLFAFIELEPSGTLLFFVLIIIGVQVLFGGVLEPVLMGKTFSINVVTVLIMLMLWGYIWGVAGLIMAIPITVFIKIILSQFPRTQVISDLMSGSPPKITAVKIPSRK